MSEPYHAQNSLINYKALTLSMLDCDGQLPTGRPHRGSRGSTVGLSPIPPRGVFSSCDVYQLSSSQMAKRRRIRRDRDAQVASFCPGAGNYRECAANLLSPLPTLACLFGAGPAHIGIESSAMPPLATVASLTTGYGGLSDFGLVGYDFPLVGFIISVAAMSTARVLAGVIRGLLKNGSWHSTVTTTRTFYGHDSGGCPSRLDAAFGVYTSDRRAERPVGCFGE